MLSGSQCLFAFSQQYQGLTGRAMIGVSLRVVVKGAFHEPLRLVVLPTRRSMASNNFAGKVLPVSYPVSPPSKKRRRHRSPTLKSGSLRADKQAWRAAGDLNSRCKGIASNPATPPLATNCCDFADNPPTTGHPGIQLKCFIKFGLRCGRFVMKRRTARQLVTQLADLRHLARCSALRASATSRTIGQSPSEEAGQTADSVKQESFAGAEHEIHA
jgi:hypothetical protein